MFAALLAALGFVGGFLSGLLGIGGGIVMVPLLLYVPPRLGFPLLDMRIVAGMTMVQVFAAAMLGYLVHRRRRAISAQVVRWMGSGMVLGTAGGGVASRPMSLGTLEAAFVLLAVLAAPVLFAPPPADEIGEGPAADFSRAFAAAAGLGIGFLSGLVGVGGAFLVIPVMIYLMGVPTRVAIGSSLGILVVSSLAGLAAKAATGQVSVGGALALCAGTLPGSWLGAALSARVPARRLRLGLAVLVTLTAVRMLIDLLLVREPSFRAVGRP